MFAFHKTIKSIFLPVVYFQLTIGSSILSADVAIDTQERTVNQMNAFIQSGAPSDLPFVDYMEQFQKSNIQPLKMFDLSTFTGKQMYVGYGTFDAGQRYCKYVEQPGLDPNLNADKIETHFHTISTFNKHTYAQSINEMSITQCQALVDKFGGYIATPTSVAESGFLSSRYFQKQKWLGIERGDCSTGYTNQEDKDQEYFNWSTAAASEGECDATKLKVYQNAVGKWSRATGSETKYCVLEVDAQDIRRPVKICAPWWRVEREYQKDAQTDWGEGAPINIYRINQADIPELFNVCTAYNTDADANLTSTLTAPRRQATCTTYYDATIVPECIRDTKQPQCFVNECSGYLQNACHKVEELTPLKDYTKTQVLIDGVMTWIRGKDGIKTIVYDCPPSPPSLNDCIDQSSVIIYPKECPGSQCEALKTCIFGAAEQEEKDACHAAHPCEKIYGSPDLPVIDSATGVLTHLKGICADGTELLFEPDIQNKVDKKCLEYEIYTTEKEVRQNCVLDRPYSEPVVDVSLTADDIYMNNPNCIRLNNLFDSRPVQEITFDYINKGFAKTVIKKSYINDTQVVNVNTGTDDIISFGPLPDFFGGSVSVPITTTPSTATCSITEPWVTKMGAILEGGAISVTSSTYDASSTQPTKMKIRFENVVDATACTSLQSTYGTSSEYNTLTKVCNVYYTKQTEDLLFKFISGLEPTVFLSETTVSKTTCKNYAECIGGAYNEGAFDSGNAVCSISAGENYSAPEEPGTIDPGNSNVTCIPTETAGAYTSQLDGTEDIFSVQESVSGHFGYYSNYTTPVYKHNVVSVAGNEIYPIKEIPMLEDRLTYEGIFRQDSILTKSPNILAGVVGLVLGGIVLGYLGAVIFGKKQKFNEQWSFWIVFKLVPISRYVENVYGYDYRILEVDPNTNDRRTYNSAGVRNASPNDHYKLIYALFGEDPRLTANGVFDGSEMNFTGTLKPGNFVLLITRWLNEKKKFLICRGFKEADIPVLPVESGVVVGYPSCKWYQWSCNKRNRGNFNQTKNPFYKEMRNQYAGAINGISVVVPYDGDYEVKAYDKHGNLLGQVIVYEDNFLAPADGKAGYAQVMFGLNMDIASGVIDGTTTGACRYDLMSEWGGGVSGIYYENDYTGMYHGCAKSNDSYVLDHAAVKLEVMSLGTNRPFTVELEKPLPWANRVFLVSMNEKEIRKYRCYTDFGTCQDTDYITEGE